MSNPSAAGLSEPCFIIKLGAKYYVTTSVLEYDPAAAGATAAQTQGVAEIAALFAAATPRLDACQVAQGAVTSRSETKPPQH